jgi:hypothetical protein
MTAVKIYSTWIALAMMFLLAACGGDTPATQTTAPGAAEPSKAPDEKAAISALMKISEAQSVYFARNRRYALAFDELVEARDLDAEPTAAETGYEFRIRPAADAQTYTVSATPASSAAPTQHFFTDKTGVIHGEANGPANAQSPVVPAPGAPSNP